MSERSPAQQMRDDDDHRLRVCGLLPNEREQLEREDFESRAYDFIFAPRAVSDTAPPSRRDAPGTQAPPRTRAGQPLRSVPHSREAERAAAGSSVIAPPVPGGPATACKAAA